MFQNNNYRSRPKTALSNSASKSNNDKMLNVPVSTPILMTQGSPQNNKHSLIQSNNTHKKKQEEYSYMGNMGKSKKIKLKKRTARNDNIRKSQVPLSIEFDIKSVDVLNSESCDFTTTPRSGVADKSNNNNKSYFTCKCDRLPDVDYACMKVYKLIQELYHHEYDHKQMKQSYQDIQKCGEECQELQDYDNDIEKDLVRTFPKVQQYACEINPILSSRGQQQNFLMNENLVRLKRVLLAFSFYDHSVGYMQGMNYIMASIMYHCNEEVSFWIFIQLLQLNEYGVRSIYQPPNMPGLHQQVKIIERIIQVQLPKLNNHMVNVLCLTTHHIYLNDWVICLFTSIMPIDMNMTFLIQFFKDGWMHFYQMCIAILKVLQPYILGSDQLDLILSLLKFKDISNKKRTDFSCEDFDKTLYELALERRESMLIPKTQSEVYDGRSFKSVEKLKQNKTNKDYDTDEPKNIIEDEYDFIDYNQAAEDQEQIKNSFKFAPRAPFLNLSQIKQPIDKQSTKSTAQDKHLAEGKQFESANKRHLESEPNAVDGLSKLASPRQRFQSPFSIMKTFAGNIGSRMQGFGHTRNGELEIEKEISKIEMDLSELNFDELWVQIFEIVHDIQIDPSTYHDVKVSLQTEQSEFDSQIQQM